MVAAWLAACSPQFDWRETRAPEQGFIVALPDKPQTVAREVDYRGPGGPAKLTMTMTSTGVGPSLFAVGVVTLPPAALAADQVEATAAWFRDALLRNVNGKLIAATAQPFSTPPSRQLRLSQSVRAQGQAGRDGKPAALAARFIVVDDRLYQVVALGAEDQVTPAVLDTFFDSFRLLQ